MKRTIHQELIQAGIHGIVDDSDDFEESGSRALSPPKLGRGRGGLKRTMHQELIQPGIHGIVDDSDDFEEAGVLRDLPSQVWEG